MTIRALISSCLQDGPAPVLPTIIFLASRRAKSKISGATRSSIKMMSADCNARTARSVNNSGSPGPAPTSVTEPASVERASLRVSAMRRSKSACDGSWFGCVTAKAENDCQNVRRAENGRPDDFTAARQRCAAATHREKPRGIMASSLARIAWAKTGAAPSVEIPMTSGERLTMEPKAKSQNAGLSMTFTGTPARCAASANRAASRSSSKLPTAIAAPVKSEAVQQRSWIVTGPRGGCATMACSSSHGPSTKMSTSRACCGQQLRLPGCRRAVSGHDHALAIERQKNRQAGKRFHARLGRFSGDA